jgi:23S rRNA (guanosine2251-2'-O)-methyltransferase
METLKVRPKAIKRLLLKQNWEESKDLVHLVDLAKSKKLRPEVYGLGALDKLGSGHQGVALEVSSFPEINYESLKTKTHCMLLGLDGIEDPQNLGGIIRTSWLFGVDGLFIPKERAAGLTPTVTKVASGGVEHVPIQEEANIATALNNLKSHDFWVFGLSEKGDKSI